MKLQIKDNVYNKIRFYNNKDTGKEVSGIARYVITKEKNGFPETIVLQDFIMLDMGTGVSTEFSGEQYAKILYKWKDNIDDNTIIGIIHSHVSMNTTHSSIDIQEMKESTPEMSFLVSTIFNHKMEITSKLSYKDQYKITHIYSITDIDFIVDFTSKEWQQEIKKIINRNKLKIQTINKKIYGKRISKPKDIYTQPNHEQINKLYDQQEIVFQETQEIEYYNDNYTEDEYNKYFDMMDRVDKACSKIIDKESKETLFQKYNLWINPEDLKIYKEFSEHEQHKFLATFELFSCDGADWNETEIFREEMLDIQ